MLYQCGWVCVFHRRTHHVKPQESLFHWRTGLFFKTRCAWHIYGSRKMTRKTMCFGEREHKIFCKWTSYQHILHEQRKWQYGGMVYHKRYWSYSVCFLLLHIIIWSQQLWSLQWNFVSVTKIYRGCNRKIFLMLSNTSCSKTVKCWMSASGRYIDLFKFADPQTSVLVTLVE